MLGRSEATFMEAADNASPTEREQLMAQARKKFEENGKRLRKMILTILQAQVTVEQSLIDVLHAYGKDPKHFFFTGEKIKECKRLDPPGIGPTIWDLLSLCSHVRNELMHSLDDEQIKAKSNLVREAYLTTTEAEHVKQGIREMTDTQVVMSAIYHCGCLIVVALDRLAREKK
jgi:hypothetical protein